MITTDVRWQDVIVSTGLGFTEVNVLIELEDWQFIDTHSQGIHLVHKCETKDNWINITTYSAWHKKRCTYCDEPLPDDVFAILHTIVPNGTYR